MPTLPQELPYWLKLWLTPGVTPKLSQQIIATHSSIKDFFNSPDARHPIPLTPKVKAKLFGKDWSEVDNAIAWQQRQPNHHIVTYHDPLYPSLLKQIADPPLLLFIKGNPKTLSEPQVALVGSRNHSQYGKQNAFEFAKHLARSGLTVTSGLALGIDTASHQGALAANGSTLAVIGSGLQQLYPSQNLALADTIAEQGAVLSEFPLNLQPTRFSFPRRNRIISGLSVGVLVVEAAQRSGSLITARLAMEQNREVFALPGNIHNPTSRGCHQLIKEGAKLVETAHDILDECKTTLDAFLQNSLPCKPSAYPNQMWEHTSPSPDDPELATLLTHVDSATTPFDSISARSGLHSESLSSMLLLLELDGFIKSVPGGYQKIVY